MVWSFLVLLFFSVEYAMWLLKAFEQALLFHEVKRTLGEKVLPLPSPRRLGAHTLPGAIPVTLILFLTKILYADILKRGKQVTSVARDHTHDSGWLKWQGRLWHQWTAKPRCHQQSDPYDVIGHFVVFHICLLFSAVLVLFLPLGGGKMVLERFITRPSKISSCFNTKTRFGDHVFIVMA